MDQTKKLLIEFNKNCKLYGETKKEKYREKAREFHKKIIKSEHIKGCIKLHLPGESLWVRPIFTEEVLNVFKNYINIYKNIAGIGKIMNHPTNEYDDLLDVFYKDFVDDKYNWGDYVLFNINGDIIRKVQI